MNKPNKYCLPTPDAISFTFSNKAGVINYLVFDGNGINSFFIQQATGKVPQKGVKGTTFFGSLTPQTLANFTKTNPLKLKGIQVEFESIVAAPSNNPQNIPTVFVQKGNIDGINSKVPIQFNSKRNTGQFQSNIIYADLQGLVIDGNTGLSFTLTGTNQMIFTLFIEEILTC